MSRLYQNFKSIGSSVLPTEQLKFRILCPPYLKNGLSQLKSCLYSILILPNLDLIIIGFLTQPHITSRSNFFLCNLIIKCSFSASCWYNCNDFY
ncbi:hypothetical protein O3M35_000585 [Rhynocoris fuscipes]|uniref:Maturase K n=1 Tax=Rhynocoris fuscipes TaxID=488301 RepID=A0AAW1DM50_9HEMI